VGLVGKINILLYVVNSCLCLCLLCCDQDFSFLQRIVQTNSHVAVFFVKMSDGSDVPENNGDDVETFDSRASPVIQRQLSSLGFLSSSPDSTDTDTAFNVAGDRELINSVPQLLLQPAADAMCDMSEFGEGLESQFIARLTSFVKLVLESRLLSAVNQLYEKHQQCLNVMIDSTFVAANDVACTPARLKYAREQEVRYCNLSSIQFIG